MRARKRIGVIGAGPAGLACIKELSERGHDVVACEAQSELGGLFAAHEDDFVLTTSSLTTRFGAWAPGGEGQPTVWTRKQYLEILRRYAEHFDLASHIRFDTRVTRIQRTPGPEGWRLHVAGSGGGDTFDVDHVAICSGLNRKPDIVELPGRERFRGRVVQASEYRSADEFAGARVLVIGLGESGSDIALEIAHVAAGVAISTRNGPGFVIPRYFAGLPSDVDTTRCYHAIPYRLAAHPIVRFKTRIENSYLGPGDDREVLRYADDINRRSGFGPFRRFGTKNTSFIEAMIRHGAESRPGIRRLDETGVEFVDGSRFECDAVVCCTGYRSDFSLLADDPDLAVAGSNPRRLYKRMLDPRSGSSIAWIGFVRPGLGSIPPCAELQARYFALLVSGERQLPSVAEMQRDIEKHERIDLDQYARDADRLPALTDYLRFMDSLAEVIGCTPPLRRLLWRDLRTWIKIMFGPITGLQYRLVGPGADPDRARAALRRMPSMPWPVAGYELLCLVGATIVDFLGSITRSGTRGRLGRASPRSRGRSPRSGRP